KGGTIIMGYDCSKRCTFEFDRTIVNHKNYKISNANT
ncbi:hypothetical protein CN575_30025, partial [Bacillus wiedmannii]